MKKVNFLLAFFAWTVMMYATDPALPTGIRVDTAYVANDLHIELEYSVLVPFGKVYLSAYTSVDDTAARQSSILPVTLSGATGTYKRRIPVNLPLEQVAEILILLQGEGFTNRGDSAQYASAVQNTLYVKRQKGEVVNYRTTYTEEEKLVLEANLKHYRIYNSEGKLTDGWGMLN